MIFDLAVLAVLLVSAVIAFLRGFIREVLTILGVVGGLVAAYFAGPLIAPMVRGWFDSDNKDGAQKLFDLVPYDVVADAIAYGSVFIVVVIVLSIASHLLSGWAKAIGLGAVDRTLGVIFGLVRGVIILGLLYLPVHVMVNPKVQEEWFDDSRTLFYVAETSDWMMSLLPDSFKEGVQNKAQEAADTAGRSARETLQELDVLNSGQEDETGHKNRAGPPRPEEEGYRNEQRQDLNELFEDRMND